MFSASVDEGLVHVEDENEFFSVRTISDCVGYGEELLVCHPTVDVVFELIGRGDTVARRSHWVRSPF